jgi:peptidoglycan-N-acetylglucosamine deacetylase
MCRSLIPRVAILSHAVLMALLPVTPVRAQSPRRAQHAEVWGFTGPWDPMSANAVRTHGSGLDAVITGWIGLDSATARPIQPLLYPDTVRPRRGTLRRMAIVTSWHGDRFHPTTIRTLAADPRRLAETASLIARHAASMHYRGLVLDFEALSAADTGALALVVRAITDSAHRRGVRPIAVAIPAADTAAYPARLLLRVADLVIPMLYDQHWAGSTPGPVADPAWVRQVLAMRIAEAGGSERIVAGVPGYGYRWWQGGTRPTDHISFREARQIATDARVPLVRDSATRTLRAARPGEWELWVADAGLLRQLVSDARAAGVRRFALWRMGQEDDAIWSSVFR